METLYTIHNPFQFILYTKAVLSTKYYNIPTKQICTLYVINRFILPILCYNTLLFNVLMCVCAFHYIFTYNKTWKSIGFKSKAMYCEF